MTDERNHNFGKLPELIFRISGETGMKHAFRSNKILKKIIAATLNPGTDFFKIIGRMELPHNGCAEFIWHNA